MLFSNRYLLLLILCALSRISFAADYYFSPSLYSSESYPTAELACRSLEPSGRIQSGYSFSYLSHTLRTNSTTTYNCRLQSTTSTSITTQTVSLRGSSCPTGQTFNSVVGRCESPAEPNGEVCGPKDPNTALPKIRNSAGECVDFPFADKPSQCKFAESRVREVSTTVQFDSNGVPSGPPTVDVAGCVAVPVGPNPYKNCKAPAPRKYCFNGVCVELGTPPSKCNVAVQFTGEAGDGDFGFTGNPDDGTGPCDPDTDCTPATPPIETDRQPCTYVTDAEGRQSCTSFDYKGVPGESSQCGEVNGQMQCIAKKPPTSNGTQIDTKVDTKSNPDGTTTTTKTDIRTDVVCSGPNSCQSVTTKTTNVTIKDGNGNTTSSDTKCEGAKCSSGIGKGDGTGTGDGDCIVDCESESGEVSGPELGEVSGFGESLTDFMSGVEQTPLMTAISGIGLTGGGSCSFPSATTIIGTISFDSICSNSGWLDPLYYVFMAIWAFLAVRVLMSA